MPGRSSTRSISATAEVCATIRDQHETGEALGCERDVLGEPVVVRAHQREVEVDVLGRDDGLRETRGGVEDLGVDAVLVHLREPGRRVVAAGAHVLEARPRVHVAGCETRARVHAEVDRVAHALDHPRVTLFEAVDPGRAVAELGRHPGGPEVAGFVDVAVAGDEAVRPFGHRVPCSTTVIGRLRLRRPGPGVVAGIVRGLSLLPSSDSHTMGAMTRPPGDSACRLRRVPADHRARPGRSARGVRRVGWLHDRGRGRRGRADRDITRTRHRRRPVVRLRAGRDRHARGGGRQRCVRGGARREARARGDEPGTPEPAGRVGVFRCVRAGRGGVARREAGDHALVGL